MAGFYQAKVRGKKMEALVGPVGKGNRSVPFKPTAVVKKLGGNARLMTCGRQPDPPPGCILKTRGLAGNLDPSGAPKADADLLTLHQDRDPAVALGEPQHLGHGLVVLFDIPINDRQPLFALGLPGLLGKRSARACRRR